MMVTTVAGHEGLGNRTRGLVPYITHGTVVDHTRHRRRVPLETLGEVLGEVRHDDVSTRPLQ